MSWILGTPITGQSILGAPVTTVGVDTTGVIAFVAFVSNYAGAAQCTVTDSKSNTWTARTALAGTDPRIRAYLCIPTSVGLAHTFTADSGDTSYPSLMVLPITAGADVASFFDKDTGKAGVTNAITPDAAITPTNDGSLVIAALSYENAATPTIDESYDSPTIATFLTGNHLALAVARWIQTTKTATQPIWTESGELAMTVVVLNAGGGGGGTAYTLDCQPGSYAVTGSALTGKRDTTMNAAAGSYAFTGVDFTNVTAYTLNAQPGQYDITGFFIPGNVAAYTLDCQPGSYSFTGSATGALNWIMNLEPGTYLITGQRAGPLPASDPSQGINTDVFIYLHDTVYSSTPSRDLTTMLARRIRELGGDATAAFKAIIIASGTKN